MNNLRSVDLNLLVVLNALLTECHVSRAATQLGMSQPAVSQALARLRYLFDDPLFVRGAGVLRPTARAIALAEPLRDALDRIRGTLVEPTFDPLTAKQTFRLAMSDYGAALVLPKLMTDLRKHAPGIELVVTQSSREEMANRVLEGELDLALGVFPNLPPQLRSSVLFEERFVCIADRDNPILRNRTLTLESYLQSPHVLVSVRGEPVGEVEAALADLGLSRRVVAILPHFLVAPDMIANTDLLLTIASRGLRRPIENSRLIVIDPPVQIAAFSFLQIWHTRNDASQSQAWLRQRIAAACI